MRTENRSSNTEMVSVAPAEQHQGEPVAWYRENAGSKFLGFNPSHPDCQPLYTRADPGEVERLRALVELAESEALSAIVERDDLRAGLKWESERASLCLEELQECESQRDEFYAEITGLRARLAVRDALLTDIEKRHWSGVDFDLPADLVSRIKALSTSAEPSAPVERAELVSEDELRDLASSACQSALAHGISEDWFFSLARTVEQRARAKLSVKP